MEACVYSLVVAYFIVSHKQSHKRFITDTIQDDISADSSEEDETTVLVPEDIQQLVRVLFPDTLLRYT